MIKKILTGLGIGASLVALAGFGGALHPIGDSLAVFQLPLALAGAVLLLAAPRALFGLAALVLMAVMLTVLWPKAQPEAPGPVTIYQKNLNFRLSDPGAVAADILRRRPDVVTLQEVNDPNRAVLDALKSAYPTQAWCQFAFVGGVAVATSWPALGVVRCSEAGGLAALRVQGPSGPLWLVSLHLHWPWPHGQAGHVAQLIPLLESLDAPIILAGDFNMVPWGHAVAEIARATGTVHSSPRAPTYWIKGRVPLPIDHVFAGGGTGEVLPLLGSDHAGVLARVSVPQG